MRFVDWGRAGLLGLAALLASCSLTPPTGTPIPPERRWTPPAWTDWAAQGRLAIQRDEEGLNAGFRWRQAGEAYDIRLSGPLGQGGLRIHGDRNGVLLETDDGRRDGAADPERLLARYLGWSLPVSGLRYWVRGEAEPGQPARWQWDELGRPRRLSQSGWDIAYLSYSAWDDVELPRLVRLARSDLEVRLLIDQWERLDD